MVVSIVQTVWRLVAYGFSFDQVMMDMDQKDINAAFEAVGYTERTGWEQTRLVAYHTIAPHMKQPVPLKRFMGFEWEKTKGRTPTREDFERLKKKFNLQ